ncbi:uncharacterized protein LOC131016579 [Salvia miltiorrhiza]|uniref:uncharacterized protein LOC131016579 n=1 Tax=Salvia miltiorrhiza TaxID=226208 RepID=UPI0025AC1E5A|nr:uncharacterized protein LOC131016579 [Salvia miltiorrhiza]
MFESLRSIPAKSNIFSTVTFLLIIIVIISSDSIISNVSLNSDVLMHESSGEDRDHDHHLSRVLHTKSADGEGFNSEITYFFSRNRCRVRLFMTWISPADFFGERELFGLESLFKTNPKGCLIILSNTLDSIHGSKLLQPLIEIGFRVRAISLDLSSLFNDTPAEIWFDQIKNGSKNAGEIPLPQNLSNLIRLAALYKYGGVYLDTDFIILKDLSRLRNSIGAQSVDVNGNWTRLNNAILVFDKNHQLVYKFMEEFASTFDGNIWGHNGPYLVTRVVDRVVRVRDFNFTILPPIVFYPVDWIRIPRFFARPDHNDLAEQKWVTAKLRHLSRASYGVHLWNRQSSRLRIEEGSVISSLISDYCILCNTPISSS